METPTSPYSPRSTIFYTWQCWLGSVAIFLSTLFFYTSGNKFPYFYHPDEPKKALQVMEGTRNMNHPLLLLTATTVVTKLVPGEHTQQQVTVMGRWVSAGFAAGGITALALTGLYLYGWSGMFAAAAILIFNSRLFEFSHYMKEDTALVLGVSCFILAVTVFWRERSRGSLLFLGIASALAVSGKYIGVVIPLGAIGIVAAAARTQEGTKKGYWLPFLASFIIALALINYRVFTLLPQMMASIENESRYIVMGNDGLTRQIPHKKYLRLFFGTAVPALIFIFAYLGWFVKTRRERRLDEWVLLGTPFAFGLILSFVPAFGVRYYLPISALVSFIIAVAVITLADVCARRWQVHRVILLLVGLAIVLPQQVKGTRARWKGFAYNDDPRLEMLERLKEIPENSVVVADNYVRLKELNENFLEEPLPLQIKTGRFAADIGSLDELNAMGVNYVVVCDKAFTRVIGSKENPVDKDAKEKLVMRRNFYNQLFEKGSLIWENSDSRNKNYRYVKLRIYKIDGQLVQEPVILADLEDED